MRRIGFVGHTEPELRPHDHIAWPASGPAGFVHLVHRLVATTPDDVELVAIAQLDEPDWNVATLFAEEIAAGRLHVRDSNEMYRVVLSKDTELHAQLGVFDRELRTVLEAGSRGVCVVADNTPMATGSDVDFERWLSWEQLTDRWLAVRPITGMCYFDTFAVDAGRIAAVDAVHPASTVPYPRAFRLFHDADEAKVVRMAVAGSIDAWDVDEAIGRILAHLADTPSVARVLDLSRAEYVDHRLLITLRNNGIATVGAHGLVERLERIVDDLD